MKRQIQMKGQKIERVDVHVWYPQKSLQMYRTLFRTYGAHWRGKNKLNEDQRTLPIRTALFCQKYWNRPIFQFTWHDRAMRKGDVLWSSFNSFCPFNEPHISAKEFCTSAKETYISNHMYQFTWQNVAVWRREVHIFSDSVPTNIHAYEWDFVYMSWLVACICIKIWWFYITKEPSPRNISGFFFRHGALLYTGLFFRRSSLLNIGLFFRHGALCRVSRAALYV